MSAENGIIKAPVSFGDVNRTIGTSHTDLGTLCKDGNINKWAMYKPVSKNKIGLLTQSDRGSVTYGLTAVLNTAAQNLYLGNTAATDANFNTAVSSSYDWTYTKPSGGANSPYRLHDFLNCDTPSNWGYVHNTKPPFEILGDFTFTKDQLTKVSNVYWADATVPSGDITNWQLKIYSTYQKTQQLTTGVIFTGYKARWGTQSQDNINGASTYVIPITYLLGDTALNQNWRMGMLVYAPACTGFSAECGLFVSKTTIKYAHNNGNSGTTPNMISIELCTNQLLAQHLLACMGNATSMNFRALPVMIKDCYIQYTGSWISGQEHGRTYITQSQSGVSNPQIYSLPCGSMETAIVVTNGGGGSDTSDATSAGWTLGTKFTGTYVSNGSSASIRAINLLCIFRSTSGAATTFTVNIDYQTTTPNGVTTTTTINQTYSAAAGQKFTSNGQEYFGITIIAGPELVIKTIRTFVATS